MRRVLLIASKQERRHNPLRLRYILPPTQKQLEEFAKTYAIDRSKAKGQETLLKEWESRAQKTVARLAKRDGIPPPKVEVSPNAEIWANGRVSGGYYVRGLRGGKIGIGNTVLITDMLGMRMQHTGKCPSPLWTLLHEYRHHYQHETLGTAKVNEIYEKEGSVGWSGHKLENDADDFAEKECRRLK